LLSLSFVLFPYTTLFRSRYVLKSRPFALIDCHCIDCRRSAGAPYVTWGSVPRKDLVVTKGEPRKIAYANRIRSFAACCGTHLFLDRKSTRLNSSHGSISY